MLREAAGGPATNAFTPHLLVAGPLKNYFFCGFPYDFAKNIQIQSSMAIIMDLVPGV